MHAERNVACAQRIFGPYKYNVFKNDVWIDLGPVSLSVTISNGSDSCSYHLESARTSSGHDRWFLTLESGELPEAEQRIQKELMHEAELADQYFHALWRPWERLWIEEIP
jgi:hypothetical protein